jgi:hypothetical protein
LIWFFHIAFSVPWFLIRDFNETLKRNEINSGYFNLAGSRHFQSFLDLLEYPLTGHRYTWFRGRSMSRMDHAFSSPDCHVKFSGLFLTRLPRGLSDDCELLLGNKDHKWGWKPFCFMDSTWLWESLCESGCFQFSGRFKLLKKRSYLAQ